MKIITFIFLFIPLLLVAQQETYVVEKASFSHSGFNEIAPVYYENGLVFSMNNGRGFFHSLTTGNQNLFNIFYVDTTDGGNRRNVKLFSKDLTSMLNDGPVTFNSTGDTVYFSRNRLVEGRANELSSPLNTLGIFSAVLRDGKWTNIREFRYNSDWYNLTTPCLSPDGNRLYFASDKPDGYGGFDLYYSEWKNGFWNSPVNLGPVINTEGNEVYPYINPAGDVFFSSDGHPGMGGKDIFYSRFTGTTWREPVALDPPINSEYEDFGFVADTFMNQGYFSSNRDNSIDIYHFNTVFPQIFYTEFQRENLYCYVFNENRAIKFDTTELQLLWHFGDGGSAYGAEVRHCYPGPGDYEVHLDLVRKGTDNLFYRKLQYTLKIRKIEQAFIDGPDYAVTGDTLVFTGVNSYLPGYRIINFAWDFGDGNRLFGDSVKHAYALTGDYDVNMVLILRSELTGVVRSTEVSKRVKVLSNVIEQDYYKQAAALREQAFTKVQMSDNTQITDQFPDDYLVYDDVVYRLELLSSPDPIGVNNVVFRNIPNIYTLKTNFNLIDSMYSYTVEQQADLMSLYPAHQELRRIGYTDVQVKLFQLKNPSERELHRLLKTIDISTETYFDRNERLSTDAFIMLDQVMRFLTRHPGVRLEIGVHTDNVGPAARNLSLSQQRANLIVDYLIDRGIQRSRLTARGYGGTKPIAPNRYELDRRKNRRVEFVIL